MHNPDVIIIGAGVIGLTSARELSRCGLAVTVIDRQQAGRGASRAAGGILSPLRPWTAGRQVEDMAALSIALYPDFIRELHEDTGINAQLLQSGMIVRGRDFSEPATRWARERNIAIQPLDTLDLPAHLQRVIEIDHGVFLPDVCQLRNPLLLQALEADVISRGVRILCDTEVTAIKSDNGRITAIATKRQNICAEMVVVCAGAWSGQLSENDHFASSVRPIRGQMIWYQAPVIKDLPIVDDGEHYAVRRIDGVTLVGSTIEDVGFDQGITPKALKILKNKAGSLMKDLAGCQVLGQWSGLRPSLSEDGPLIAEHPSIKGLFFNTGHHRNGVTLAPVSAQRLARVMQCTSVCQNGAKSVNTP